MMMCTYLRTLLGRPQRAPLVRVLYARVAGVGQSYETTIHCEREPKSWDQADAHCQELGGSRKCGERLQRRRLYSYANARAFDWKRATLMHIATGRAGRWRIALRGLPQGSVQYRTAPSTVHRSSLAVQCRKAFVGVSGASQSASAYCPAKGVERLRLERLLPAPQDAGRNPEGGAERVPPAARVL